MSALDTEDMTIDKFKFWSVSSLKDYLRRRNLSCVGNKEMLVARAFSAHEMNIKEAETAAQTEEELAKEYRTLLTTPDEGQLPDPYSELTDGWENEEKGLSNWPPTMIQDISAYLSRHDSNIEKVSLSKRLLSDYKDQKAYSYFSSNWLFEVHINKLTEESAYCFMKACCRPSQRLSDIPHDVWVCIQKASGTIQSAYCTCFAGLGQTCNHVAALLLKIDFCWQYGYIQKACTSKPCMWLHGGKSAKVVPQKVKDMNIKKPTAENPVKKHQLNTVQKRLFTPHKEEKGIPFKGFLKRLENISPSSVTVGERLQERHPFYVQWDKRADKFKDRIRPEIPPSMTDLATAATSKQEFMNSIPSFDVSMIKAVEIETRGQADNPVWFHQRKGRITASKFHDVVTRMETFKASQDIDISPLISRVLGYVSPPLGLPALKYGRRMEDVASREYASILRQNGHKNIEVSDCGLYIDKTHPFLAASPDRIVNCCCGTRVLEIKCPLSCSHAIPTAENVDFLIERKGKCLLNENHKYFDQIQGQMAIVGCDSSDLFVYSRHGYFKQTVPYSESRWKLIQENTQIFFMQFLAEELVSRKIQAEVASRQFVGKPVRQSTHQIPTEKDDYPRRKPARSKPKPAKGKQPVKKRRPIFMCGTCQTRIKEANEIKSDLDQSVMCDKCHTWYHWTCVNLQADSEELEEEEWICQPCLVKD